MSKYTSEVRFVCESMAGLVDSVGYVGVNDVIANARGKIFDFDYPIFDEAYRPVLETKILKHYYTREIGAESVGLWKLWLDSRLNEIMPYYNQLYKSELLEFNPMYDVDLTTDHKRNVEGNETRSDSLRENSEVNRNGKNSGESNSNQNGGDKVDSWVYYSDTPQGGITGLADMTYLTNATHTVNDGREGERNSNSEYEENVSSKDDVKKEVNSNGNNTLSNVEDYLEHVKGKTAGVSYSKRLMEYRQTFLNIDMLIIEDLSDLFMNLW